MYVFFLMRIGINDTQKHNKLKLNWLFYSDAHRKGGAVEAENSALVNLITMFSFDSFPTIFMLWVSFSPVLECVVSDCWKRDFRIPPPRATRALL